MFINKRALIKSLENFNGALPFNHCVIDNFFKKNIALSLEKEFPNFNSNIWHQYNNPIEVKKVCNDWNIFPKLSYQVFAYLNSSDFISIIESSLSEGIKLFSDIGLNGGGWHIHARGGKLNTHLDYSIHPKLGLQRKLNIIIYLNSNWKQKWGGELGFWSNESSSYPGSLAKEIVPKFNRAVLFDTTQNSWHGLPKPLRCPKNEFRKSIAVYYLCSPSKRASQRGKALFSPTEEQSFKEDVLDLIKKRSDSNTASSVYKSDSTSNG